MRNLTGFVAVVTLAAAAFLPAHALQAQPATKSNDSYPFRAADLSASPRMTKLRADIQNSGNTAVEQFWSEQKQNGTPLIEPTPGDDKHSLVTFLWRGSPAARNVVITDGVSVGISDAEPLNSRMTRIENTDVWYRTYDVRNDARFTYSLSENDPLALFTDPARKSNSTADPLNPHRFSTGQTYLELRDAAPQPWITPNSSAPAGKVENTVVKNYNVWVYTPADFQRTGDAYPLIVVMGGRPYMNFISVTTTLDNLIFEKRIPPSVAVIVSGSADELSCSSAYADFLANELVPWMRTTYHATNDPSKTVIGGSSLGGLASTFAAVNHSDVFGKVLSQSGSYWWRRVFGSRTMPDDVKEAEWLTRQIATLPRLPVQFFMEIGLMESSEAQVGPNRRMRDTLTSKGYTVHYQEFNGNHNYINWRGTFGEGLVILLGR